MTFTLKTDALKHEDEIGFSFLIAEDEEGHYEPVEMVSTITEAVECAESDLKRRLRLLDRDEDPGLCPYQYVLFSRTINGNYEQIGVALVAEEPCLS